MTVKPCISTGSPSLAATFVACLLCASCALPDAVEPGPRHARSVQARTTPQLAPGTRRPSAPAEIPQDVPTSLTLREALRMALESNKDIKVDALGSEADRERVEAEKGQFDPELFAELTRGRTDEPVAGAPVTHEATADGELSVGITDRAVTGTTLSVAVSTDYERDLDVPGEPDPAYAPELRLTVEQELLRGFGAGVNRVPILIARNNARVSREEWRATVIRTLFEVERAYWELYFGTADLRVREQQLVRAERLVGTAEAQVKVGISAPLDVVRARSSAASQEVALVNARSRVAQLRHALLRLLGVIAPAEPAPALTPTDAPPALSFAQTLADSVAVALQNRPDQAQALLALDTAALQARLAKNERLPSLKVFGNYALAGLGDDFADGTDVLSDGDFDTWSVGMRFEVPIPNRTGRANYSAARLDRTRAAVRLKALEEVVTRDVADALTELRAAEERISQARRSRELAQQVVDAEEKSFTLGRSNSRDVLDAQASLATAERDEVRARVDQAIALANLYRVQGVLVEKKGIAIEGGVAPPP